MLIREIIELKDLSPIKRCRINAGLTQQQLADMLGVMQHHISRWETGERAPSALTLLKISKILKCNIEDLVTIKQ